MLDLNEKTLFAIDELLEFHLALEVDSAEFYINPSEFYNDLTMEKLKDLCGDKKFLVFNETDGFFASQEEMSIEQAIQFMEDFPKRYKSQGYYRTSKGEMIPPSSVRYGLIPYEEEKGEENFNIEELPF